MESPALNRSLIFKFRQDHNYSAVYIQRLNIPRGISQGGINPMGARVDIREVVLVFREKLRVSTSEQSTGLGVGY